MDDVVILDNGFKVNLKELEERICGIQGIEDALVYWQDRNLYADILCADGVVITNEDIREKLFYYEDIEIRYVKGILLNNGKKKRRINV